MNQKYITMYIIQFYRDLNGGGGEGHCADDFDGEMPWTLNMLYAVMDERSSEHLFQMERSKKITRETQTQ